MLKSIKESIATNIIKGHISVLKGGLKRERERERDEIIVNKHCGELLE